MRDRSAWHKVFPLDPARQAVAAMLSIWNEVAQDYKPGFHIDMDEPDITVRLKDYLVDATESLLPGFWTAEDRSGKTSLKTGKRRDAFRTDIVYLLSGTTTLPKLSLVFEFKWLDSTSASRTKYCGDGGMMRFVTGPYSQKQPLAVMVGLLREKESVCVPKLRIAIRDHADPLCIVPGKGKTYLIEPPETLPAARFETEHIRPIDKVPEHGTIRIAHLFLGFGYPSRVARIRKERKPNRVSE